MPYEACLTPLTYFNFLFSVPLFVLFRFIFIVIVAVVVDNNNVVVRVLSFSLRNFFSSNELSIQKLNGWSKREKNKVERKWPIESSGSISLCCMLFIVQLDFFLSRIDCQRFSLRRLKLTRVKIAKHTTTIVWCTAWKRCEQLAFWTLLERNNCLMLCFFYEYYHRHHHHHRHRQSYGSWIVCVCANRKNPLFQSTIILVINVGHVICVASHVYFNIYVNAEC